MTHAGYASLAAFFRAALPKVRHLHSELPYRVYDAKTTLFHNTNCLGFGKSLAVLGGASMELVQALNALVCNLPEGDRWDYQFVLTGTNQVGHLLEANKKALSMRGGIMAACARNETLYAQHSARQGFASNYSNHHYDLKDYNAWLFVSTRDSEERLLDVKATLESELTQAGFHHEPVDAKGMIAHIHGHLNFDGAMDRPEQPDYNEFEPLSQQMVTPDAEFRIHKQYVDTRFSRRDGDNKAHTRLVSLGLKRLPSNMSLGQVPNLLASMLRPARSLRCPHRISINFRLQETAGEITANERKIGALTKIVNSPMRLMAPFAGDELVDRRGLQRGLHAHEFKVAGMVLNLTLYTNEHHHKDDVAKATSTFQTSSSQGGLDICVTPMFQAQSLLSVMPFQMTEGYWRDCQRAGRVRTLKTSNLVNFFPVVAELKRLSPGLLLPTLRHQISFFDPFNCGSENYNMAVSGGSGAGKSFLMQSLIKSVFARGGKVWILDKGDSYQKLTRQFGGVYMNHRQIFLNPFTHLGSISAGDDEGGADEAGPLKAVLGDITGLIATMAAPNTDLDDYQVAAIGDAIIMAWEAHGADTLMDHVQEAFRTLAKERDEDRRLYDLADQLNRYCRNGIYGDIFNRPSQLDPTIDITTLELDGFTGDVLRPVVFALMVSINQQMYLSGSRFTPKVCLIEEAWALMSGSNRQSRQFIEQGYRTARKFGGSFCTVTQSVGDFFASPESEAAYSNSDIRITLRQGGGFDKFTKAYPGHFLPTEIEMIRSFPRSSAAGYSCCMLSAGGVVSFHRLFADVWTRALLSTEPNEFEFCDTLVKQGTPLQDAVTATAKHFYADEWNTLESLRAGLSDRETEPDHA